MDKVREALADLKGINTNDPITQSKVVKVLEAIVEELDGKVDIDFDEDGEGHPECGGCNCNDN